MQLDGGSWISQVVLFLSLSLEIVGLIVAVTQQAGFRKDGKEMLMPRLIAERIQCMNIPPLRNHCCGGAVWISPVVGLNVAISQLAVSRKAGKDMLAPRLLVRRTQGMTTPPLVGDHCSGGA